MNSFLSATISLTIGASIVVGGVAVDAEEIVQDASKAVNKANRHQFATVLEVYYLEHGQYPEVSGGEALVDTLINEGYLRSRPLDASDFSYKLHADGEDYTLEISNE